MMNCADCHCQTNLIPTSIYNLKVKRMEWFGHVWRYHKNSTNWNHTDEKINGRQRIQSGKMLKIMISKCWE